MTRYNQIGKVHTTISTEYGWTSVRYHQTDVIEFNDRFIRLNSGGWRTATTKTRINQTANQFDLGITVWQTNWKWTVKVWSSGLELTFIDDMLIDRKTGNVHKSLTVDQLASESLVLYSGDVNPEYGGLFVDLSNWSRYHYANVTRITDLDSGAGFTGAVILERGTVNLPSLKTLRDALKYSGGMRGKDSETRQLSIVESLVWYMGFDVDNSIIIQTDSDGPMRFDGWRADIKLSSGEDLLDWLDVNRGWIET